MKNEFIYDLSFDDYLKLEAVSKSGLNVIIDKSPLHFKTQKNENKDTPALRLGRLIHTSILEPEKLDSCYAVLTEQLNLRTKADKEKLETFKNENKGKTIISLDEFLISQEIKKVISANSFVKAMMKNGRSEVTMLWDCEGVQLKGRADFITNNLILDVKTTTDASEKVFTRSIYKYKYHMQAAMYCDGYKKITGKEIPFVILAIEKEPPYDFALYLMDSSFIDHGRILYMDALETYRGCLETDNWFGYEKKIKTLEFWGGN